MRNTMKVYIKNLNKSYKSIYIIGFVCYNITITLQKGKIKVTKVIINKQKRGKDGKPYN